MSNLVSGWTEGDYTYLVQRTEEEVKTRRVPARWAFFVKGLEEKDRNDLARDRRVKGVSFKAPYTRVDCRNRWGRKDLIDILEVASSRTGRKIEILEGDLSPLTRLMSDIPALQVSDAPKLGYFDLESDSRATFDQARMGEARLLSWAFCDVSGNEYYSILEDDDDRAERKLFHEFFESAREFDVLLAWNGDGFDFPLLQNRAMKLGLEITWPRWCWLDHMAVFKKYNMHSDDGGDAKASFKLDHVAHYLLGEGKSEFDASKTWEAWEAGGAERKRLLDYNRQDTRLLPRIEDKTGFLALHIAVCHVCRIFPDSMSLHATAQGDGFLCRLGDEYNFRWPTKRRIADDEFQKFKGAFVMEPTRLGAIENVHVCDFAGLYPSIMRTFNMSPDTKVIRPYEDFLQVEKSKPLTDDRTCQLPNRPCWFRTDRDGMFRIALDQLVAKRGEYTAEMKKYPAGDPQHERFKRLSGAFKIVANSFYGICGSPYSRFFDVDIAEGVTQTGKWLLEQVIENAREMGMDPFYGDTDSAFVQGEAEQMKALVKLMNESWRDRLRPWGIKDEDPCHVDLDFEKTFLRIIMVSAKRYAGRYKMYKGKEAKPDAPPEVKGLEFKRGDTIKFARLMQSEIVYMLLEPELPKSGAIKDVLEKWKKKILYDRLTMEDVVISQALSKPIEEYSEKSQPAHVRVAKLMRDEGEAIGEGARVQYIVVGSKGKIEAIPAYKPNALERVDRAYYWEKRIYPATERILEKVYKDQKWNESKEAKVQRSRELAGQTTLSFDGIPTGRNPNSLPRRRKKFKGVTIRIFENNGAEDGAAEGYRRKLMLEAVRAVFEANPGEHPTRILIVYKDSKYGYLVKVAIPTVLKVDKSSKLKRELERVIRNPDSFEGFAT